MFNVIYEIFFWNYYSFNLNFSDTWRGVGMWVYLKNVNSKIRECAVHKCWIPVDIAIIEFNARRAVLLIEATRYDPEVPIAAFTISVTDFHLNRRVAYSQKYWKNTIPLRISNKSEG